MPAGFEVGVTGSVERAAAGQRSDPSSSECFAARRSAIRLGLTEPGVQVTAQNLYPRSYPRRFRDMFGNAEWAPPIVRLAVRPNPTRKPAYKLAWCAVPGPLGRGRSCRAVPLEDSSSYIVLHSYENAVPVTSPPLVDLSDPVEVTVAGQPAALRIAETIITDSGRNPHYQPLSIRLLLARIQRFIEAGRTSIIKLVDLHPANNYCGEAPNGTFEAMGTHPVRTSRLSATG